MYKIGDLSARTGVAEPTLRMWERRHGFPAAIRTEHGHRRYRESEVDRVRRVAAARAAGIPLATAIARALDADSATSISVFATLRRRQPELPIQLMPKRTLVALSRGIEDEVLARAERGVVLGCFQREHFYRQSQARWCELAQGAAVAAVFADFSRARGPGRGPAEIPVAADRPLAREWGLVYCAEHTAICLAGRERADSRTDSPSSERAFETIWTVDPMVTGEIAASLVALGSEVRSGVGELAAPVLGTPTASTAGDQLALSSAVFGRTLAGLA